MHKNHTSKQKQQQNTKQFRDENNKKLKKKLFKKRQFSSWEQMAISCQQVEIQIDKEHT